MFIHSSHALYLIFYCLFFFRQKTAYEMRISDWSSDVCSSDLEEPIHALDGFLGHDSNADLTALHVDRGGVSDIVFATMHLLGLDFEIGRASCRERVCKYV